MSLDLIFKLFVLIGFASRLIAALGGPNWLIPVAWGSWLLAAILWAVG
jgi:hypothetical protein